MTHFISPQLTVSDSGIRIDSPTALGDEILEHFQRSAIECIMQPGTDANSRRIVFLSPYAVDRIMATFRQWQAQRQT